ncbi:hypothetical protein Tco_0683235 [Tanacetum coccineum]|uniref:Uncharacterized protein n=1 Tax=Tanacetum coccineum TaxID=301880 RepID=A0ABQ4XTE5_9ASTR
MSQKFALLEEERPIIETMAFNDKYKKILDEVWKDNVELDGKIVKEEEEAVNRIKGDALKEKEDHGAFIFPIRLEGKVNKYALEDTCPYINTMPYRIYKQLGREDIKKVDRGITMINHTPAEAMGILINVLCQVGVTTLIAKFLILDISIDRDSPIVVSRRFLRTIGGIVNAPKRLFSTFDGFCHQTFRAARSDFMRNAKSDSDDEEDYQIKRNNVWKKVVSFLGSLPVPLKQVNWKHDYKGSYTKEEEATGQRHAGIRLTDPLGLYQATELDEDGFNVYFEGGLRSDEHFNAQEYWLSISREENLSLSRSHASTIRYPILRVVHKMITYGLCQRTTRWMKSKGADDVIRSLSALIYCRDLDMTTLRELIDSEGRLVPEDPQSGVPRIGIPRPPRASMQDLYDRMGRMEIRQEAIERMEYKQSYH